MKAITKIELGILYDTYGMLLTDRQQHILQSYCYYDCSLSEISEQTGISRQAVHDSIVNAEHSMLHYEQCLSVVANNSRLADTIVQAKKLIKGGSCIDAIQLLDTLTEE